MHRVEATRDVSAFDRFARVYDLVMPAATRSDVEAGFRYADREVDTALDVGGGAGRVARILDQDVTVVDAAHGMLRQARRHGLATLQADAGRLPVRAEAVDAVVVVDALHHFADAVAAVEEAHRVLRPGGVLVVRDFDPTTLRGRALVAAEHAFGFDSRFRSPDDLATVAADAGFDTFVPDRGFAYTLAGVR